MKLNRSEAIKLAQMIYGKQDERVKEIEQVYKDLQTDVIDTINSFIDSGKNWNVKASQDEINQFLQDLKDFYDDLDEDNQKLVKTVFNDDKLQSNGDLLLATLTANLIAVSIYQKNHLIASTSNVSNAMQSNSYKVAKSIVKQEPNYSSNSKLKRISGSVDTILQRTVRNAVLDRHINSDTFNAINKQTIETSRKIRQIAERAAKSDKDSLNWKDEVANVLTGGHKSTNGQMGRASGIIRTATAQTVNRIQLEDYKRRGVKQYEFISLEAVTTCQNCNDLDGKIFDIKDAQEGLNFPLMHYNCQCTTREVNRNDDWDTSSHDITDQFNKL